MSESPSKWCVAKQSNGGGGGSSFETTVTPTQMTTTQSTVITLYGTVSKITCYVAEHRLTKITLWYSNLHSGWSKYDGSNTYGENDGEEISYTFSPGETLKSLRIYKADYSGNTYCGGMEFATSLGKTFTAVSSNAYGGQSMDVGFGLVLGAFGRCGEAVDQLGLWLLKPAITLSLCGMGYTLPPPSYELIDNTTYTNTEATYSHPQTTAIKVKLKLNCSTDLSGGAEPGGDTWVPFVVEQTGEGTAGWSYKVADLTGLTYAESDTSPCTCTVSAPDGTSVNLTVGCYTGSYTDAACSGYATVSVSGASGFSFTVNGSATGNSSSPLTMTQTTVG